MIPFEFAPLMQRLKINQRMLSLLLRVSKTSISQWVKAGTIPAKHLTALIALTAEDATQAHIWMPCNLRDLRERLGMKQKELARRLQSSQASISHWEQKGRIPRDRLLFVEQLKAELPQQQECA